MDETIKDVRDIPYTVSFVLRKRMQIDNLNELPRDERPPDDILWSDNPEDLEGWIERVVRKTKKKKDDDEFIVDLDEVEG